MKKVLVAALVIAGIAFSGCSKKAHEEANATTETNVTAPAAEANATAPAAEANATAPAAEANATAEANKSH